MLTPRLLVIYKYIGSSANGPTILRYLTWHLFNSAFQLILNPQSTASGVIPSQQVTPCPITMMIMNVGFAPDISVHDMPWILIAAANTYGVNDAIRHSGQSRLKRCTFDDPMPTIFVDCASQVRTSRLDASLMTTWFQRITSVWPVTSNSAQATSLSFMMLSCTTFVSLVGNILPIRITCEWY